jgi:molybdopterin synthase catalytic subunit
MQIRVLLFAILRDDAGTGELHFDLPNGSTVAAVGEGLVQRYPQLAKHLPRVAYAVNQAYVKAGAELKNGDEVALIPPVSGG